MEKLQPDDLLVMLADYVKNYSIANQEAYETARLCLADTIGCGILALNFGACVKLLGPIIPGTVVPNGVPVPGTLHVLDPIRAAFNIGTLIRWLDYNDTWLGAEWGHPSDNLGGLLAAADYQSRVNIAADKKPLLVRDLLTAMVKAHEIQGCLAILNSFNKIGLDHVILVKVATAAVTCGMLGGSEIQIIEALSQAWADGGPLRVYRHAPNTGSRKSWAAGDATSRGLMLSLMTLQGEMGYPQVLTAKKWGLYDVFFKGMPFILQRPLGSYVMENVLFKVSFPAEFHAQTAVEAAIHLHPKLVGKFDQIKEIRIQTHEAALRIIDKKGPLRNPADRDHCMQYMVAIGLLYGNLSADDYEEERSQDPRIDLLRNCMVLTENPQYTLDYHDPSKRSIANTVTVVLNDGTTIGPHSIEYPLGHKRRRHEAIPLLLQKLNRNLLTRFSKDKTANLIDLFNSPSELEAMPINVLSDLLKA